MKKILDFIDNINEWIGKTFSWISVIIMMLTVFEVFMRKFLRQPTIWTFEVSIQLFAFYFMILAAYGLLNKVHVSIDILYNHFSQRTKAIIDIITDIVFFFPFLSVLLYEGTKYAMVAWQTKERSWTVFSPPLYPLKTVIPVMALLLLLQGGSLFIRRLHSLCGKKRGKI